MKRITFLKSLLLAALLSVGGNAWAQTTAFSRDFTGVSTNPSDYGFSLSYGNGSGAAKIAYSVTNGLFQCVANNGGDNGARTGLALATFDSAIEGNKEILVSFDWSLGNQTGNAATFTETYIGNSSGNAIRIRFAGQTEGLTVNGNNVLSSISGYDIRQVRGVSYNVSATLNLVTKKITTLTMTCSNSKYNYSATDIDFESSISSIDRFAFNHSARQTDSNTSTLDNILVQYNEIAVTNANYTINYKYNEETIKSVQGNAAVGSTVNAESPIWINDVKYYAKNDAVTAIVIASNDNTLDVNLRMANTYNWIVKASTGIILASGSNYESESVTYYWPARLNFNGVLYETGTNNSMYKNSFTLDSDNKEVTVSYNVTTNSNLLYLAEGEDIFSAGTGSNADIRLSMGKGGYASSKTSFVILPAGEYKIGGVNRGGNSGSYYHTFYKGDEEILKTEGSGSNSDFSSEFTLSETTAIYMKGGSNNQLVDYVYITGTPTNEVVGAFDYTTAFMGAHKDVTISKGQQVKFTFNNHGNGAENWNNWLLRLSGTTGVDHTLRADNFVIGNADSQVSTRSITENGGDINWSDFLTDMQNGSVELTATYTSEGMFSVVATATGNGNTYVHNFAYNDAKSGDILMELGVELAWLEVLSTETVNEETYTATFYNDNNWTNVYAYTYNSETLGTWPGTQLSGTDGVYTVTFNAYGAPANIIFNNGNSGTGNQTADLDFEDGANYCSDGKVIYTAYYQDTYSWGTVYAYAWSGDGDSKVEQMGTWSGKQLTKFGDY